MLNDEALLTRLAVREGRNVLPHGTSYAALALVPGQPLRPEVLRKIRDLVADGATLIAPRPPERSASLENYPDCDRQVARLSDELWGNADRGARGTRNVGKGRVIADQPLTAALDK